MDEYDNETDPLPDDEPMSLEEVAAWVFILCATVGSVLVIVAHQVRG